MFGKFVSILCFQTKHSCLFECGPNGINCTKNILKLVSRFARSKLHRVPCVPRTQFTIVRLLPKNKSYTFFEYQCFLKLSWWWFLYVHLFLNMFHVNNCLVITCLYLIHPSSIDISVSTSARRLKDKNGYCFENCLI
jgi:hypothetical protein